MTPISPALASSCLEVQSIGSEDEDLELPLDGLLPRSPLPDSTRADSPFHSLVSSSQGSPQLCQRLLPKICKVRGWPRWGVSGDASLDERWPDHVSLPCSLPRPAWRLSVTRRRSSFCRTRIRPSVCPGGLETLGSREGNRVCLWLILGWG